MLKNIEHSSNKTNYKIIEDGIYQTFILDWEKYSLNKIDKFPLMNNGKKSFGMCDKLEDIKENFSFIFTSEDNYFILMTEINKKDIKKEKEYKWDSWGGYYGKYKLEEEWFSLEKKIDKIFAFHIMKILDKEKINKLNNNNKNIEEIILSLPMNKFSVDGITTEVINRKFDGEDINLGDKQNKISLQFKNPLDNKIHYEQSTQIKNFGFNGTAILTPSAFFDNNIGVNNIKQSMLKNNLLLIDISKVEKCDSNFLQKFLKDNEINLNDKYIVLFYTGLMNDLKEHYKEGIPNNDFWEKQSNRPYLTTCAVDYLNELDIATSYMIDNVSFENNRGSKENFPVTSSLINYKEDGFFKPLMYHLFVDEENFHFLNNRQKFQTLKVEVELGNQPDILVRGCSVLVRIVF